MNYEPGDDRVIARRMMQNNNIYDRTMLWDILFDVIIDLFNQLLFY